MPEAVKFCDNEHTNNNRGQFWAYSEYTRIWEKRFGIEWSADV